jgi:membrane protease YdiL (CAAX protease family)
VSESASTAQKYLQELQLYASAIALVAAGVGIIVYLMWRKSGLPRQYLGKEQIVKVPWDWLEVFVATVLLYLVMGSLPNSIPWGKHKIPPEAYGNFQLSVAASVMNVSTDQGLSGGFLSVVGALSSRQYEIERQIEDKRSSMLYGIIIFPFILLVLFNIFPKLCNARFYQMGLHMNRLRENITLGSLVWLIATPLCIVLMQIVALHFWETLWGRQSSHHLANLLEQDMRLNTWLLVGFVACVVAPLCEELLVRGIIQPYLVRYPVISDVIIIVSIVTAFTILMTPGTGPDRGMGMGPLLFVATIAPGYYLFEKWLEPWIKEPGAARGVYASSLIFAVMHVPNWPHPIPLFILGLALGLLAYRTRSLVGSITVHALFNLTTMVCLALQHQVNFK